MDWEASKQHQAEHFHGNLHNWLLNTLCGNVTFWTDLSAKESWVGDQEV